MKILTTILTCTATQNRADACLGTWVRDIKKPHDYLFYGDHKQSISMAKTLDCTPDLGEHRQRLPEKTFKMLVKALDYEWDFLFKCDDDTFVTFDRLIDLLKNYNFNDDLYIGCKIVNPFPYGQGGAGFVLTRSAVKKCIELLEYLYNDRSKNKNAEDYSVGLALKEQNINLISTDLLSTPDPAVAEQNQSVCIDAINKHGKITTHYVQPHIMRHIYNDIFKK